MAGIPSDVLAAAQRYGHTVDSIARRYRNPKTGKPLSGTALLLKLSKGENGYKQGGAPSSAGARSATQFTPGSRKVAIDKFGVDPWKDVDSAFHAAALHLRGKINGKEGLEGYNPGMSTYASYILGQSVGDVGGGRSTGAAVQKTAAGSGDHPMFSAADVAQAQQLANALAPPAQERKAFVTGGPIQLPAFASSAPQAFEAPQGGAPTGIAAPQTDVRQAMNVALSQAATMQTQVGVKNAGQIADPESETGKFAAAVQARANTVDAAKMPYLWGGGHAGKVTVGKGKLTPLDCSGAVSAVLGIDPRVSGDFEKWGRAGDGGNKGVTVYSNGEHVLMKINGHFFGTSKSNPGGGAGWIPKGAISKDYLKRFTARHTARA